MRCLTFLTPPGSRIVQKRDAFPSHICARRPITRAFPQMSVDSPKSKKPTWWQTALIAVGGILGTFADFVPVHRLPLPRIQQTRAAQVDVESKGAIPLQALGIKRDDYVSDRELRRRKTTQYSEAEQEIIELEEYEVATQWFRDLQTVWAALASVGGIMVLYKGGVLWERWIKEQEKKDIEEEIKLTGTFIDPRAVRKDEDEGQNKNKGGKPDGKGPKRGGGDPSDPPNSKDYPPDGLESLEKLYGKS